MMGDPSVGAESWAVEDLDLLWTGEAMRLVRRGPIAETRVVAVE